ncbi:MAG: hypothetical protein A2086_08410 [Spirochaetes bacterium GWD1_27_9]|nr:MAG: hypothetical protein A2Z98_00185 [Spirochaetes bacterium GWB1_27_13]OHD20823.1 MAG: hypothetical protein A2Y34_12685 [Spirochaetes bacterium GWC1_27_15]OHD30604.1 MAG: hypothetical protein A2086_08410 [Spirochaetes bacterium GWD1_27_9]
MNKLTLIFLFFSTLNFYSMDKDKMLFWEIQSENNTVYLLASVLSYDEYHYPLRKEIEEAYYRTSILVYNFNYNYYIDKKLIDIKYMVGSLIHEDNDIKDIIPEDLYKRLKNALIFDYGVNFNDYTHYRPWFLAAVVNYRKMVSSLGLQLNFDMNDKILLVPFESYFLEKVAYKEEILIENELNYITFLDNLPYKYQNLAVRYSLNKKVNDIQKENALLEKFSKLGKYEEMEDYLVKKIDADNDYQVLYIIYYRNKVSKMFSNMEEYLQDKKKYFIILDIHFLIGELGLINRLKQKGYTVEQR